MRALWASVTFRASSTFRALRAYRASSTISTRFTFRALRALWASVTFRASSTISTRFTFRALRALWASVTFRASSTFRALRAYRASSTISTRFTFRALRAIWASVTFRASITFRALRAYVSDITLITTWALNTGDTLWPLKTTWALRPHFAVFTGFAFVAFRALWADWALRASWALRPLTTLELAITNALEQFIKCGLCPISRLFCRLSFCTNSLNKLYPCRRTRIRRVAVFYTCIFRYMIFHISTGNNLCTISALKDDKTVTGICRDKRRNRDIVVNAQLCGRLIAIRVIKRSNGKPCPNSSRMNTKTINVSILCIAKVNAIARLSNGICICTAIGVQNDININHYVHPLLSYCLILTGTVQPTSPNRG